MNEFKIVGNSLVVTIPTKYHEMYDKEMIMHMKQAGMPILAGEFEDISLTIDKISYGPIGVSILFYVFDSPTQIKSIKITGAKTLQECFNSAKNLSRIEFSYYKDKDEN